MKPYWEKLKDPRWQRKRLEVLESNDFECEVCGDGESTLHVHHKQYFKGREPWEYDRRQLAVLCESCHSENHEAEDPLNLVCSYLPLDGPYSRTTIASFIAGLTHAEMPENPDPHAYYAGISADNILHSYSINIHDAIALADLSVTDGVPLRDALLDLVKAVG